MTLGDYVNVVCTTVNRTDVDSKTACRLFVNRRYNQIYDAYLWRDAEFISAPFSMSTQQQVPTPQGGPTLPFPAGMDRVVKLGLYTTVGGNRILYDLRPSDSAFLMETRPEVLTGTGTPEFYEEISGLVGVGGSGPITFGHVFRIYPSPDLTTYQFVAVGKATFSPMVSDSDAPKLRNVDNAIISFSIADMLKRDRHYAKAAQQLQEAQTLLQEAIAVEEKQSNAPRAAKPLSVTGGTLDELTDAVSSKLDMWDARAVIKIREAIRRCYQELYDMELWTESVVILSMQAQGGVLIMPPYIEKILALANQANFLVDVAELEYLFRTDPDIFNASGSPTVFSVLPPVAVSVLPASTGSPIQFVSDIVPSSAERFTLFFEGEDTGGLIRKEYVSVANGVGTTAYSYTTPFVISKPQTLGNITVSAITPLTKLATIPAEISSLLYQRIWVQPIDSNSANGMYFVLGKRQLQQLLKPMEAVKIRGCENALINMVCADLATGDQAAKFDAEAQKLIQILVQKETNQNARRITVTPYTDRTPFVDTDSDIWLRG